MRKCYRGSRTHTAAVALMIWLHRLLRTYESCINAFVAPSRFLATLLTGGGIPWDRVFVRPFAVAPSIVPLPWEEREPKVMFVGRVEAAKGVFWLLEAWRRLGPHAPRLEMAGDGPVLAAVDQIAREDFEAGKVRVLGQLERRSLLETIARARLLVAPSIFPESFGLAVAEAMALGVPVVGSALGAYPELIEHGRTGLLVSPNDPEGLASAVEGVWRDEVLLRRMAEQAREWAEGALSPGRSYRALAEVYAHAAEGWCRGLDLHEWAKPLTRG